MPFKCCVCGKRVIQAPNYFAHIGTQLRAICDNCVETDKPKETEVKK